MVHVSLNCYFNDFLFINTETSKEIFADDTWEESKYKIRVSLRIWSELVSWKQNDFISRQI